MTEEKFHSIRLHGPWQATVLEVFGQSVDLDATPTQHRLKVPSNWGDWLGVSFAGRVLFTRPFHLPTGLEPEQCVYLAIDHVSDQGTVSLNGKAIGTVDRETSFRSDVTKILKPQNHLKIEIEKRLQESVLIESQNAGGLTGSVRLEIGQ